MKTKLLGLLLMLSCICSMQAQSSYAQESKKYTPTLQGYIEMSGSMSGSVEFLPALDEFTSLTGGMALDGVIGCQLRDYVFLGCGLSINLTINPYDILWSHHRLTNLHQAIFADVRFFIPIPKTKVKPYFETSIGPNLWDYQRIDGGISDEDQRTIGTSDRDIPRSEAVLAYFHLNTGIEVGRFTCGIGYELRGNRHATSNYGFVKIGIKLEKNQN